MRPAATAFGHKGFTCPLLAAMTFINPLRALLIESQDKVHPVGSDVGADNTHSSSHAAESPRSTSETPPRATTTAWQ